MPMHGHRIPMVHTLSLLSGLRFSLVNRRQIFFVSCSSLILTLDSTLLVFFADQKNAG